MAPIPTGLVTALQDALIAAQQVASDTAYVAIRTPPAATRLAAQAPDLLDNLAAATERVNATVDRLERVLNLLEPLVNALDTVVGGLESIIPALEEAANTGATFTKSLMNLPIISQVSKMTGLISDEPVPPPPAQTPGSAPVPPKPKKR